MKAPAIVALLVVSAGIGRSQEPRVTLGVDVLLREKLDLVRGPRVGLVTNASGVNATLRSTADLLFMDKTVKLTALFGPEHGIRGDAPGGQDVPGRTDAVTGLPVYSLYGKTRKPTADMLKGVDVLVFDIQDIGSRTYTYLATLGVCMEAAAEHRKKLIVLDRPNPIGGLLFEGPVIREDLRSFVGPYRIPVTHGMTFGEMARYLNEEEKIGCDLVVVPMKGWKRGMVWEETGLTWIPTSPHIPHPLNARLYVATGMVGGTTRNVNEGVGYTLPFETIGGQFIDGPRFSDRMNARRLPGVSFRPIAYRPFYGDYREQLLSGVQLLVGDPHAFRPLRTALAVLVELHRQHPGKLDLDKSFEKYWGTPDVRRLLLAGASVADIEASFADDLAAFGGKRARYLLYGE